MKEQMASSQQAGRQLGETKHTNKIQAAGPASGCGGRFSLRCPRPTPQQELNEASGREPAFRC